MKQNRRDFIKTGALVTAAGFVMTKTGKALADAPPADAFTLPPLPYDYAALEPFIDKQTMELHHDKHHATYVTKLNAALATANVPNMSIEDLCKNISKYDMTVRNNGGGHYNHSLFWNMMKPKGGGPPDGKLLEYINSYFVSFENFKTEFTDAATKRFGSGWAWLVQKPDGKLAIGSTPNQDNPLMDISDFKGAPLLALDVWEHAYYLKYQNKRSEYINAFWNLVNWEEVSNRLG